MVFAAHIKIYSPFTHGRSQDFFSGGGGETLFQKNFQKILKKYSKNIQKILKNSKNFQKYSKNIWKIFKNFLKKFAKNAYFSIVFSQFNEATGQFLRVWTKNAICRKFLRTFSKIFLRKL